MVYFQCALGFILVHLLTFMYIVSVINVYTDVLAVADFIFDFVLCMQSSIQCFGNKFAQLLPKRTLLKYWDDLWTMSMLLVQTADFHGPPLFWILVCFGAILNWQRCSRGQRWRSLNIIRTDVFLNAVDRLF